MMICWRMMLAENSHTRSLFVDLNLDFLLTTKHHTTMKRVTIGLTFNNPNDAKAALAYLSSRGYGVVLCASHILMDTVSERNKAWHDLNNNTCIYALAY